MEINILSLSDGAKIAKGITVIIDVYRAFTTQSFAFENGVKDILNVSDIEQALDMKENGFGDFCMGEIGLCRKDKGCFSAGKGRSASIILVTDMLLKKDFGYAEVLFL